MEIGWEYNDENWYRPECEGGMPKIAYESKEDARIACAEINAKKLESPHTDEMIVEWNGDDDVTYVKDFFEVKQVELIHV